MNNGHEVFFVGLYNPPKHILSAKGAINLDLNSKQSYFSFRILFKLIKLLWKEKLAIVQANGSDTLKYEVLAKVFSPRTKIIYRNISIVSTWIKKRSFIYFFNKWLFNKVDFVTSVGEETMNDFIQTYSFPPAKIKVINRGVPYFQFDKIQEKQKLSNEFHFDQNNLLMVHVGQFSTEKNHVFLIDCFEEIHRVNKDVVLLLIGEGPLQKDIKELVDKKQLNSNVLFAGHRKQIQQLLSAADIFLLTSNVEGVPGVVLEAAMQSVPSIAVSVGGESEVVIDGETGILIKGHDKNSFCSEAINLLSDDSLRKNLGKNAYEMVYKNYSLKSCVDAFENLYNTLADSK